MTSIALYIHIPYCLEKCPYCDFHSIPTAKDLVPQEAYANRLVEQLQHEVSRFGLKNRPLVSIYFGGGTPSLMSPKFFETIYQKVAATFWFNEPEVTVETNPATADKNQFKEWLRLGINRVSFGTQSFQDSLLKRLGRHHTAKDSYRCVQEAFDAGFTNVSADLIFGIKDQTFQELEFDLKSVLTLGVPHVSCYQLTVEKNTPLSTWVEEGSYKLPAEEILVPMHEQVVATFEAGGLRRYEISNYAKPGFESRHNLQYWLCNDYLGIGSGAVSKIKDRRFRTTRKLKNYLAGDWAYEDEETLDAKTAWKERWMMGIRLQEGVALTKEESRWKEALEPWAKEGFLTLSDKQVRLTEKGFLFSNRIIQNVFDLIDKVC